MLPLSMAQQPLVDQSPLNIKTSQLHSRHTTLGMIPLDE